MATAAAAPVTVTNWHIAQLERETSDGFVYLAHYTVDSKDDTYASSAYGSIGFERPENLIPYANLLEDEVICWVKDALGADKVDEVEAALQNQIDQQRNPTQAAGVPW
jgi:hypothetical protein